MLIFTWENKTQFVMKKLFIIGLIFSFLFDLKAQNPPVAVNDTVEATLGETVTVNVIKNDYHPDGLEFKMTNTTPPSPTNHFTDSTVTFTIEYDDNYDLNRGYYKRCSYEITDQNDLKSQANIIMDFSNSQFSDTIDIGNVKAAVFAYGPLFFPGCTNYNNDEDNFFEFPIGSRKHVSFVTDLWIGGLDNADDLHLAAEKYRCVGIDYWGGPVSLNGNEIYVDSVTPFRWHRVWKLTADEIKYHINHWNDQGYEPIESIKSWPAHGDASLNQSENLAPFVDVDDNNKYDPYAGDYPLIRGDQCVFFIFNDVRYHTESMGDQLGVEVHAMVYAFDKPESKAFSNTVFVNYKVFNRSPNTYHDTYLGFYFDYDIGNYNNDYFSTDVSRGALIGYNGVDFDDDYISNDNDTVFGYGENPPAHALLFLGGPYMDANALDDPEGNCNESINGVGFGDGMVDNERFGLTNSIAKLSQNPHLYFDWDYYNFLNSRWADSSHLKYGGFGYSGEDTIGIDASFIFPGLTDSCFWGTGGIIPDFDPDWKEETASGGYPDPPGYRRAVGSMGPFIFYPNTFQNIDVAFVTAQGEEGPYSSVELVKSYIDTIRAKYISNSDDFGNKWLGESEYKVDKQQLRIYPNPAGDEIRIDQHVKGTTIIYSIYDSFGRMMDQGEIPATDELKISVGNLMQGIYVLIIRDQNNVFTGKILKK